MNNKVRLVGTLLSDFAFSYEIYGEHFYEATLKVERLNTEHSDEIPIVVSDRLIDVQACGIGTRLSIDGQFRSYNKAVEGQQRKKLMLSVFAKDAAIIVDNSAFNEDDETSESDTEVGGDAFEEEVHKPTTLDENEIELFGFICKEPIYRYTPLGREITDCLIAVNRRYGKSDYIPCIAWGRNSKYLSKLPIGTCVEIKGRIQSRIYKKRISETESVSKTVYEVSISSITEIKDSYKDEIADNN